MSTRTKTYIAFDGDSDLMSYRTVQSWSENQALSFTLNDAHDINTARDDSLSQSIINQLRERLDNTKILVVLVGDKTKYNRKGILKYELQYALRKRIPIQLSFIGFEQGHSKTPELWSKYLHPKIPTVLTDASEIYGLVSPFTRASVEYAVKTYSHLQLPSKGFTWNWR